MFYAVILAVLFAFQESHLPRLEKVSRAEYLYAVENAGSITEFSIEKLRERSMTDLRALSIKYRWCVIASEVKRQEGKISQESLREEYQTAWKMQALIALAIAEKHRK